ncbi:MAG TPA: polyprenyl synthetase [Bacteroidetes bacterium]|nr:polyprenyl synthetase [Bacteroidota bacterium]
MSEIAPVNIDKNLGLRVRKVDLSDIQRPIAGNLKHFRTFFRKAVKSEVFLLDQIVKYLLKTKGKELRPALVFLTARLCGEVNDRTYVAATMIELLHSATLIHDDIVDEADERRGFMSINKIWKNKASVLLGDYLLAKGLLVALDNDEFELLKVLSTAVKRMSEGELRQLKASKLQNMTEDRYFKVISEKTASLISACCECGAISTGSGSEHQDAMREFGQNIGMAFQIRDDLFDFGSDNAGKTTANDIIERKMTLPMIYALDQCGFVERRRYRILYRKHHKSPAEIEQIIKFVHDKGGVTYATAKMHEFAEKALLNLSIFPESDDRFNLDDLLHFVISRKK